MLRRPTSRSACLLGVCLGLAGPPAAGAGEQEFTFYHENVMGTALELRVRADDAEAAGRAEARVLAEIDRLAAILSGYDPSSEFRRWQAAPAARSPVSPELFEVLRRGRPLAIGQRRRLRPPGRRPCRGSGPRAPAGAATPTADELAAARAR